jgi:hypothetical protein
VRNFDDDLYQSLSAEVLSDFYLLKFEFSTPIYATSSQLPVIFESNKYLPKSFKFDALALSSALSVDKVTLELDNVSLEWSQSLLSQDARGKLVTVYVGVRMQDGTIAAASLFHGFLDGWELIGTKKASVTIVNELVFWNKKTLRQAKTQCPWSFKLAGGDCKYVGGEDWCDKSADRCEALGNQLNFGGEKYIDAIVNRTIQWGRLKIT